MESVAVSDHFQPWRHEGGHAPFSLTWMAAVGERTSTIRIGTSVPLALPKEQKHDITDLVAMEKAADALPIEQMASRWIVGSDSDAVIAEIARYVDAGLNHLVFHASGHDQRRFLHLFGRDLAPRLRALDAYPPAA